MEAPMRQYERATETRAMSVARTGMIVGCVWRGALWLALLGAGTGAVYGAALWIVADLAMATPEWNGLAFIAFVVGAAVGAGFGLILGLCLGLAVGLAARRSGTPLRVQRWGRLVALALTLILAVIVGTHIDPAYVTSLPISVKVIIGTYPIAVMIAGLCMAWAGDRLARWAIRTVSSP